MTSREKLIEEIKASLLSCPSPDDIANFIIARDKKKRGEEITLESIKANPMYSHINIDSEFARARQWILLKGSGRKLTPRFFINWLNRIEKPLEAVKCNQTQMEAF
jgi:hypothetical protein